MTKAILFDLDGTLADSIEDIRDAGNWALARSGFAPYEGADYLRFVGSGVQTLIERMLAAYPHTYEDYERVYTDYRARYSVHSLDKTRPYDGVRELLDHCRAGGVRCAVVSNKPMEQTEVVIAKLFRPDDFAYVYGQREPYAPKPAPECVYHIMDTLGVTADECLYVGDTDVDMLTARNAGLRAIGALWGFRTRAELVDAGAWRLAENARDIIPLLG